MLESLYFGRLSSDQASSHREAITAVHRQGIGTLQRGDEGVSKLEAKPYTPLWMKY